MRGAGRRFDLADRIADALPLIVGVVVALSVVLLLVAFRSVVLPLKAAAANLLSVAAAYGVLTAVFQHDWGAGLIGLDGPVPVVSFVPMIMFAVLFGLSMDYEVFLLSRVQEKPPGRPPGPGGDRPRARVDSADHHRRGADHGLRVRQLPAERRPHDQDVRPRSGGRRRPRCHRGSLPARAGRDAAARPGELVASALVGDSGPGWPAREPIGQPRHRRVALAAVP